MILAPKHYVSDIIVINRISKELDDVKNKIYTRDLFNKD